MLTSFTDWNRHFAEFDRFFGLHTRGMRGARADASGPRFNVEETESAWLLHGRLPGWTADQIDITVENGRLQLEGDNSVETPEGYRVVRQERRSTRFSRTMRLPDEVDVDNISAKARNGLLTVTLPRLPKAQPRRIPVQSA